MGERKGTNKYYPPDFDPSKHFSLDKYHGTHALRERAKKINQGILVIRFEMPYNIWCGGCGIHIGMGVRYNAEKKKVGNYYSTPIWEFRMKCHLCDQYFEIKTDPANHDYVIVSGARRKEQRWDPKENEQIVTEDKNDVKKRATDAMFKLEHAVEDKAKVKKAVPGISEITESQKQWRDDYALNSSLRKQFREEKKELKEAESADLALTHKYSLDIALVKEHSDDVRLAQLIKYNSVQSFDEKQRDKREEISRRSVFESSSHRQKSENLKNKLQSAISTSKTAGKSTFGAKTPGKSNCMKTGADLGIVRKIYKNSDKNTEDKTCKNSGKVIDLKQAAVSEGMSPAANSSAVSEGTSPAKNSSAVGEGTSPAKNSSAVSEGISPAKNSSAVSEGISPAKNSSALTMIFTDYDSS